MSCSSCLTASGENKGLGQSANPSGYIKMIGAKIASDNTCIDTSFDTLTFMLKTSGSPTGTWEVAARILDDSNETVANSNNSIAVSEISGTASEKSFTFSASHTVTANYSYVILYSSGGDSASNRVDVQMSTTGTTCLGNQTSNFTNTSSPASEATVFSNSCAIKFSSEGPPPSTAGTRLPPPPLVAYF